MGVVIGTLAELALELVRLEQKKIVPIFTPCRIGGDWQRWARDPWRFVNNPVTDADGRRLPDWRALLVSYPERFMPASDPVWPVDQMDQWGEPDTGWQELGRFRGFHREWLRQLPEAVVRKISCENAVVLFRREKEITCDYGEMP